MSNFIKLLGVADQAIPGHYTATIIADIDGDGVLETVDYGVSPGDIYGIGPDILAAVIDWKHRAMPVDPFVPPTAHELRQRLPPISRRQLLRVLLDIGITEGAIDAVLVDDPVGMIEWKNASYYSRLHPLMNSLATLFGLPDDQVDDLWGFALSI